MLGVPLIERVTHWSLECRVREITLSEVMISSSPISSGYELTAVH